MITFNEAAETYNDNSKSLFKITPDYVKYLSKLLYFITISRQHCTFNKSITIKGYRDDTRFVKNNLVKLLESIADGPDKELLMEYNDESYQLCIELLNRENNKYICKMISNENFADFKSVDGYDQLIAMYVNSLNIYEYSMSSTRYTFYILNKLGVHSNIFNKYNCGVSEEGTVFSKHYFEFIESCKEFTRYTIVDMLTALYIISNGRIYRGLYSGFLTLNMVNVVFTLIYLKYENHRIENTLVKKIQDKYI